MAVVIGNMDTAIKNSKTMVAGYVKWLEPRYSEATVRSYQLYVRNFFKYLKYWHRKIKDMKEITPEIIVKYVSFIQARSAKNGEVAKRLRFFAVKNFLEWLGADGSIDTNPLKNAEPPKRYFGYKGDILVEKEIWALLDAPAKKEKISARDKAILELLFWTAMTSRELVNLKVEDVDLGEFCVYVKRKGGKIKGLPMERAYRPMWRYGLYRGEFMNSDKLPWFFLSRKGMKMDEATITRLIQKYAKKVGIKEYVTARMIRNSRDLHVRQWGASREYVQEFVKQRNQKGMKLRKS